jgi:hypothetical protein
MSADNWGKPEHKFFAKRFIRKVRYGGVEIEVHANVVEIFTEFLRMMSSAYIEIPSSMAGWRASVVDQEALGLSVWIPLTRPWPESLIEEAKELQLTVHTDTSEVAFTGTLEEADAITRKLVEGRTTEMDKIENSLVEVTRPGTRAIGEGSSGPDVMFLQLFMNDESDDGVWGKSLTEKILYFQKMRNLQESGFADQATWLSMFPQRTVSQSPGDGGMWVRMIQALLVSLDYSSNPVTSQYGVRTVRDVRALQEANGLRVNGFIRGPEWGVLVHRPVDGFPLD